MEAGNVLLLPGLALYFGRPAAAGEILAMAMSIAASAGFLIIGAMYWRGVDRRLRMCDHATSRQVLAVADRAERPLVLLTALATAATIYALAQVGLSGAVIAAAILTMLAWLEYVNYYHRQLQHFDNMADFRRLLSGDGARRSHMSRALAAYRVTRP